MFTKDEIGGANNHMTDFLVLNALVSSLGLKSCYKSIKSGGVMLLIIKY